MLDLLAKKCRGGDLYVSLASLHLHNNEWGKAKIAIERAFEKGNLVDHASAVRLLIDVNSRLGVRYDRDAACRS
jgi:uncharacterized protein HemY